MPRIRPLTEQDRKNRETKAEIVKQMTLYGYSREKLAELMGTSVRTIYNRMSKPEQMTLEEIRRMRRIFPGIVIE